MYKDIFEAMKHSTSNDIEPLKLYVQENPNWHNEIFNETGYHPITTYKYSVFEFCNEFVDRDQADYRRKYTKILNYLKLQKFILENE